MNRYEPRRHLASNSLVTFAPGAAFISEKAPLHHHGRKRPWLHRHPLLAVAFLLTFAAMLGGGYIVTRAVATVSNLHSVSTPPAMVFLPPDDTAAYGGSTAESGSFAPVASPMPDGAATPGASPEVAQSATPLASPAATPIVEASEVPALGSPAAEQGVDTAPARAALDRAGVDYNESGGMLDSLGDQASGFSDLAQGAAVASGFDQTELEPMTIMLMGVDARPGEAIDANVRPDALAVLRLDPETGSCRVINIPRDTRVNLPGYGMTKINHALAVGGIPYQQLVVEEYLGVSIDRFALIDFNGIIELVDSVGGVTVEITDSFFLLGTTFEPGVRTLTGLEALRYSRFRGGPDGDFGRIRRQQQVLRALLSEASVKDPLVLVRDVLPQLEEHVRTDLSPSEMVALGMHFRGTCNEETLQTMSMDATVATFFDPLYNVNLSYVVVDEAEVRRKVADLMGE